MATKQYTEAVGRRKTATARVRLTDAKSISLTVNGIEGSTYFPLESMIEHVHAPLKAVSATYAISAKVSGGGKKAQATAVQLGIARALVAAEADRRKELKVRGLLSRDARAKERKKFGLKKARRAPQWSKR